MFDLTEYMPSNPIPVDTVKLITGLKLAIAALSKN